MSQLNEHHLEILQRLVDEGAVAAGSVHPPALRPLLSLGMVEVNGGMAAATSAGRDRIAELEAERREAVLRKLSPLQIDLLRTIVRLGSVSADQVDGRTARALRSRGLVRSDGDLVVATEPGIEVLGKTEAEEPRRRSGRPRKRDPRGEAILKAAEQLENAVPAGAEVLVGNIMAGADDVIAGFRTFARRRKANGGS